MKAIGQRENRWMQAVNHCVSKALVENNPKHTLFVLEDLSSIRNVTEQVYVKDRYVSISCSFYDLEQKLTYKAKQNQSSVIKVALHYTSQCVDILKKLIITRRYICLLVKIVATNQTMTV